MTNADTFSQLDTVQQREVYLNARNASRGTDCPIIVHYRIPGGYLNYSPAPTWEHWKSMELCRFINGVEQQ